MLQTFSDEQLEVTSYDSTSISGHIEVKEDGLMFLSVPYAEGWSAEVDGNPVEVVSIQDALMGIKLEKGSHDISLKYTPAGFKEGTMISAVSVFLIALLFIIPAVAGKVKKGKAEAAVASATVPETEGPEIEEIPVSEVIGQAEKTEDTSESEATDNAEAEDAPAEEESAEEKPSEEESAEQDKESAPSDDADEPEAEND